MGRRELRAILVLGLAVVPLLVLLASRGQVGGPALAAGAPGGPDSSMAGSTTFAAVGPTAIPASAGWDDILAVPTPIGSPDATLSPT